MVEHVGAGEGADRGCHCAEIVADDTFNLALLLAGNRLGKGNLRKVVTEGPTPSQGKLTSVYPKALISVTVSLMRFMGRNEVASRGLVE
jgi:hypothetical protein